MSDQDKTISYKDTLNLPRTDFPMKANLTQKEPVILKKWSDENIYHQICASRKPSRKKFILHDGPPYANGHIHMGHVLNKILKDILVKYHSMRGYYSPYVPGWDCHGLPVEHQLFKELNITKDEISPVKFRKKAYSYAMKFVNIQKEEFKRLGIFADWDNPYLTLTKEYEADILFTLADLYEKGYIYKGLKPVNWCKQCETALAEAEVEYDDKVSPSIYVKFESAENFKNKKTFFVIWTTTPWTLVANVAVALKPDFLYSFIDTGKEIWILAKDLYKNISDKTQLKNFDIIGEKTGIEVAELFKTSQHPFINRKSRTVLADYVTREEGTGCVHTAPGHGLDDFATGKKYNLDVIMPVDSKGRFTKEAGDLFNHDVFSANDIIINKLRESNNLILSENITHSYPHCWRCKNPVITMATKQWFFNVDHQNLRKKILKQIKNDINWIPASGAERIASMVGERPDWCLSRQRYWGVPIPALICVSCKESFTDERIIRKIAAETREKGLDSWFEEAIDKVIPKGIKCPKCGSEDFEKENNILDVWFDSGVSYRAVLEERKELSFPADFYLEGSDQHRGWFQSALITGVADKGFSPYKNVLTHGFVVDGQGKKMSKSLGNVISPDEIMKKYGADILRLWVASSDYHGDIKLSNEIMERLADGYRKIRNTFRYMLSNLYDFNPDKNSISINKLPEVDRWILSRFSDLVSSSQEHFDKCEFYKVYRDIYDFCVFEISAFYLDAMKDILYILAPESPRRRSVQTVLWNILYNMVRILSPIIPFTTEEIWSNTSSRSKRISIHLEDWPDIDKEISKWKTQALNKKWDDFLAIRGNIMKLLENKREEGLIGSSLEAGIELYSDNKSTMAVLEENIDIFPMLLRVSAVSVKNKPSDDMSEVSHGFMAKVTKASGKKCSRCWNYTIDVGTFKDYTDLCRRCHDVIMGKGYNVTKEEEQNKQ